MALSINTNEAALIALRTLGKATQNLTATSQRVSTGQRVSSPAEDGAVFAIGKQTASDVAAWGAVRERQVFGRLVVDTAAEGATKISNLIRDLKEDVIKLGGVYDDEQRQYIIDSAHQKIADITRTAESSTFNGKNLLTNKEPLDLSSGNPAIPSVGTYRYGLEFAESDTNWPMFYGTCNFGKSPDTLTLSYNVSQDDPLKPLAPATFTIEYDAEIALSTGPVTGSGSLTWNYPADAWGPVMLRRTGGQGSDVQVSLYNSAPPPPPPPTPLPSQIGGSFSVIKDIAGDDFKIEYRLMTAEGLGLMPFTLEPISEGLKQIDAAEAIAGDNISYWSRKGILIDNTMKFGGTMIDALQTANGAILDADMAAESAKLEAEKIKQQLAAQTLSITNNAPQLLLGLFR